MAVASTSLYSDGCARDFLEYNASGPRPVPGSRLPNTVLNTPLSVSANKCDHNVVFTIKGLCDNAANDNQRRPTPRRSAHAQESLEALGTVPFRAPVGHGP